MTAPLRLTLSEVVVMSRLSRATLRRRWRAGRFPAPVDRAKELLFDSAAVLMALGAKPAPEAPARAKWIVRTAGSIA